jgi:glutathione S-transferase
MSPRVQIVGSYLSPYVRKVLACLNLKGIDYEIDPIVPFMGDDRFTALSPLTASTLDTGTPRCGVLRT